MTELLEVSGLDIGFKNRHRLVNRVKDVSFTVAPGETLCIVGESGCGKSVTALSLMDLLAKNGRVTSGSICFEGKDLRTLDEKSWEALRGDRIAMIFQDAMSSLNPVFTIGSQLMETIRLHLGYDKAKAKEYAAALLDKVGIPHSKAALKKYPYMLSGGMRQRVMIAMALACKPSLLIADEPTTALDVTIQAQIMQLLRDLQAELGMALILITHDIGLVAEMADRVAVMYAGQIVEMGDVWNIFEAPAHPYTQALLRSVPDQAKGSRLASIPGRVPADYEEITGCRFYSRCTLAAEKCLEPQALLEVSEGHCARCWRAASEPVQKGATPNA